MLTSVFIFKRTKPELKYLKHLFSSDFMTDLSRSLCTCGIHDVFQTSHSICRLHFVFSILAIELKSFNNHLKKSVWSTRIVRIVRIYILMSSNTTEKIEILTLKKTDLNTPSVRQVMNNLGGCRGQPKWGFVPVRVRTCPDWYKNLDAAVGTRPCISPLPCL